MAKRKLQRKWKIFWSIFIAVPSTIFVIAEGIALSTPEGGDTLSEQIWALQETGAGSFFAFLIPALLAWGAWHFSIFERARKRLGPKDD